MPVNPGDGQCRTCAGALEIIHAEDTTMTVRCTDCGDSFLLESFLGDGGNRSYPRLLLEHRKGDEP